MTTPVSNRPNAAPTRTTTQSGTQTAAQESRLVDGQFVLNDGERAAMREAIGSDDYKYGSGNRLSEQSLPRIEKEVSERMAKFLAENPKATPEEIDAKFSQIAHQRMLNLRMERQSLHNQIKYIADLMADLWK